MRFPVSLDPNTSMTELHVAILSNVRKLLPAEPRRQSLTHVRFFCEGVLCYPKRWDSVMNVGSLETNVLQCHPVWMDI